MTTSIFRLVPWRLNSYRVVHNAARNTRTACQLMQNQNQKRHRSPWPISTHQSWTNGITVETLPYKRQITQLRERAKKTGTESKRGVRHSLPVCVNICPTIHMFLLTAGTYKGSKPTFLKLDQWATRRLLIITTGCLLCLYHSTDTRVYMPQDLYGCLTWWPCYRPQHHQEHQLGTGKISMFCYPCTMFPLDV